MWCASAGGSSASCAAFEAPWEWRNRREAFSPGSSVVRRLKRSIVRALDATARRDSRLAWPLMQVLALGRDPRFQRPARVPLEWLDETACAAKKTVRPASEGWSYGPKVRGHQEVVPTAFPDLAQYEFTDARVSAASSSMLLADRVVVERTPGVDVSRCNYAAGHLL